MVGVFRGDFVRREPEAQARAMETLADWYAQQRIRPLIDQRLPMDASPAAYARMESRQARGKLLLVND